MRIAVVERVSHASSAYRTFAATAAMLAGGLSAGGAKWAEVAAEREAQLVIARDERPN